MSSNIKSKKVSPKKVVPKKSLVDTYLTPKAIHDIQFSGSFFVLLMWVLFHYATIMRELVRNPYMETQTMLIHGVLFAINFFGSGYISLMVIYPYVYKDEIEEEKKAEKLKEEKSK